MTTAYILTPELRTELKKPLGMLIRGSFTETMKKIKEMVEKERPPTIISVGDTVSKNLVKARLPPKLSIVDNKVMRRNIAPIPLTMEYTIYVKNPAGTITEEAIKAIKEALQSQQRVKIVVDGEEDLLALIAILNAEENSFVIYGQPREGAVVVKATREKKSEITEILKRMKSA